jgi:hypothetical protein
MSSRATGARLFYFGFRIDVLHHAAVVHQPTAAGIFIKMSQLTLATTRRYSALAIQTIMWSSTAVE